MTLRESVRTRIHIRRRGKMKSELEGKKECNGFYRIQDLLKQIRDNQEDEEYRKCDKKRTVDSRSGLC